MLFDKYRQGNAKDFQLYFMEYNAPTYNGRLKKSSPKCNRNI